MTCAASWCRPAAPDGPGDEVGVALADVTALRVLDPRVPFTVHSAEGETVDVHAAGQRRPGPASGRPTRTWPGW